MGIFQAITEFPVIHVKICNNFPQNIKVLEKIAVIHAKFSKEKGDNIMGLSASQAREIALTARMNDIEYQGQQINQQRTTLSNQVNALYSQLLDMEVPTPPSTVAFTRTEYSGALGSRQFTIESIQPQGQLYHANLSFTQTGHFMESTTQVRVERTENGGLAVDGQRVYTLAEALDAGRIQQSAMEGYLKAIRNAFPEYAADDDTTLMNKFSAFFEPIRTSLGYEPHFFENQQLAVIGTDPGSYDYIDMYNYISSGRYNEIREYDDVKLTFDSSGRIVEMALPNYSSDDPPVVLSWTSCPVNAESVTDNAAYNAAFNKYEYDKALYDKKQQEINAKTSVIQAQDKNLELKLTRLDNERSAVKTEMDAVSKVIDDAIESGFKTFSG